MTNYPDENDVNLDRLLTHLGSAKPDAGFEQRILHAVKARQVATTPARSQRPSWAWGVASAAAFAVVCAVVVLSHSRQRVQVLHGAIVADQAPLVRAQPSVDTPQVQAAYEPTRRNSQRNSRPHTNFLPHDQPAELVSFPAPPAPLTEEEKLLVRLAHRGDAVEMAMLLPGTLDAQEAQREAEYQKFFPPPDPPDNDPPPTNTKEKGDGR